MFRAAGMDSDDALLLADSLVTADLGGTHSHGVLRVPEYVKKVTVDGSASVTVTVTAAAPSTM